MMKKMLLLGAVMFLTAAFPHGSFKSTDVTHVATAENFSDTNEQTNPYKFGDYLIVTSKTTHLHKGAGHDFKVVQTIRKNGLLKYISSQGNWHKVVVTGSDKIGFVYYKNVK